MDYIGRVWTSVRHFYNELNTATLTGAIDIIVIEHPDGRLVSSPFHVRFGKMGVLHSREKVVDIVVNGETVAVHMKLGENGEAFFVEEVDGQDGPIPEALSTSPIPNRLASPSSSDVKKSEMTMQEGRPPPDTATFKKQMYAAATPQRQRHYRNRMRRESAEAILSSSGGAKPLEDVAERDEEIFHIELEASAQSTTSAADEKTALLRARRNSQRIAQRTMSLPDLSNPVSNKRK